MVDSLVQMEIDQQVKRTVGKRRHVLNQQVGIRMDDHEVNVSITSTDSGGQRTVPSSDPAVINFYREIDHAQLLAAIVDAPPSPDPDREPFYDGWGRVRRR